MERRHFLKIAVGFAAGAAGAAALAASAQAAPLAPQLLDNSGMLPPADVRPAVTSAEEAKNLKPEPVRWGHHWHWHRRHWGWRHRHWHRHWHRRHW